MTRTHEDAGRDGRPRIALTMGDAAGVGPEVIARAWGEADLFALARPLVLGDAGTMARALETVGGTAALVPIDHPGAADPGPGRMPVLQATAEDLSGVRLGTIDARAGRAAYDGLALGIDLARSGRVDAITTLALNKESLRAAGVEHPGHTEILAERCGVADVAMMLHVGPPVTAGAGGLGVIHATLHVPLHAVFDLLTPARLAASIRLADAAMRPFLDGRRPRIALAGLNPHAGEHGLFGREEIDLIAPAVEAARAAGFDASGPIAADTLFSRALAGGFDAVIAMYHDQGHVALKSVGFDHAVNVTLGLPIIRTSVAHGTAFDIAGRGKARTTSLLAAVRVAAQLAAAKDRG
jgi:4-hydroxythreonine-4-phosphate dehydrogenase